MDKLLEVVGWADVDENNVDENDVVLGILEELVDVLEELVDLLVIGNVDMLLDVNIGVIDEDELVDVFELDVVGATKLDVLVFNVLVKRLKLENKLEEEEDEELGATNILLDDEELGIMKELEAMKELVSLEENELVVDELLEAKLWAETKFIRLSKNVNNIVCM